MMHLPIRVFRSESHRGLREAVTGASLVDAVDWKRTRRGIIDAVGRRAAHNNGAESVSRRILCTTSGGSAATRQCGGSSR